jgi:hypothetical protein
VRLVSRIRLKPAAVPLLCARCARGDHSRPHSTTGCLQPVMLEPLDFVCRCEYGSAEWLRVEVKRLEAANA